MPSQNTIQLYINSQSVDLSPDTVVALTLQANNIAELKDRQSSYTNRIVLPLTKTNNTIFGGANQFNNATSVPYSQLQCSLKVDGIEVVANGVCELQSVSPDGYEVVIYSGILGFFESLGEKTLNDLDLSALDHTKDFATIIGSLSNTSGFIYGIADYFNDSPNDIVGLSGDVDIRYLFPAVFISTIFDAIFADAGFTYEANNCLNDARYEQMVLPFNGLNDDVQANIADVTASDSDPVISQTGGSGGIDAYFWPEYDAISGNTYGQLAQRATTITGSFIFSGNVYTYLVNVSGSYIVDAAINYTSQAFVPGAALQIGKLDTAGAYSTLGGVALLQGQTAADATATVTVNLLAGETLLIYVISAFDNGNNYITVNAGASLSITADNFSFAYGSFISMALLIPNMKQKDFLKNIANMFCLSFEQDKYSRNLQIYSFDTVADNKAIARDWSGKYQDDSFSSSFIFSGYAQQSYFRYSEDDTLQNSIAYDGFILSNNKNLELAKDVVGFDFSGTDLSIRFGRKVASLPIYAPKDDNGTIIYFASEKIKYRICVIDRDTGSIDVTDGVSTQTINNPPVIRFTETNGTDLDLQSFIDEYYGTIQDILTNTKVVTCQFALTTRDVDDFDFSVPVYVSYFGAYFYVNKINNFQAGRLTSVELIRL